MIKEKTEDVCNAIYEALQFAAKTDYISYILFIGRADVIRGLKTHTGTDCVIDYELDRYYDKTREDFYIHYLRRNYSKEGFCYVGEKGIDDLSIEMMIYSHLWSSEFFFKLISRLACIIAGKRYPWNLTIPENGYYKLMKNEIIPSFRDANLRLADILDTSYSSVIRNAFAHALYNVDVDKQEFTTRSNGEIHIYTFKDFQNKFLSSVLLSYHLGRIIQQEHNNAASHKTAITEVFDTPDGIKVQVCGCMVQRGDSLYPEFRLCKILG